MEEVFGAVVATSLVLMAVFVPVSFMGGITGQMFRQFGLCLASSIGLSTLVALTLSPALCSIILKSRSASLIDQLLLAFIFLWHKSRIDTCDQRRIWRRWRKRFSEYPPRCTYRVSPFRRDRSAFQQRIILCTMKKHFYQRCILSCVGD